MNIEALVDNYGYAAILVGTFLEGETILVLGTVAAHMGYLELPWVLISAFTGTLCGDQLYFFIGRYRGQAFLAKHRRWRRRAGKVRRLLERHHIPIILGFRFLYGLRNVTPFVIGMSRVPIPQFVVLNLVGAALWAAIIGALGYAFGASAAQLLGNFKQYETAILSVVLLAGAMIWAVHWFIDDERRKRPR